ncbi:AraC family transcriptional regulator [Streptomyces boninensis]|uniref:AraC family transcriptional regulator n=1 Tax=Streptomyces boninensis TaxID=2039455 RepID=UPI003B21E9E0
MNGDLLSPISRLSVRTADRDEAGAIAVDAFNVSGFELPDTAGDFSAGFDIMRLGRMTVGCLAFSAPVGLTFAGDDLYRVSAALSAPVSWSRDEGEAGVADDRQAAAFNPGEEFTLTAPAAASLTLVFQISADTFRRHLESLLGRPLTQPLELERTLDTGGGPGGSWLRLATLLVQELAHPDSLIPHKVMGKTTEDLLLTGLLMAAGHRYGEELLRPTAPLRPATVKRALDAIHADPSRQLSTADLADISRVSARRLQESFRHYVGMTPQSYLRQVRLDHVHKDLVAGNPWDQSVSEIAQNWGFTHMGRFAAVYKDRFGASPSQTLAVEESQPMAC